MNSSDIKELYDGTIVKERFGAEYEKNRWFGNAVERGHYAMTRQAIGRHLTGYMAGRSRYISSVLEVGPGPGTWTMVLAEAFPTAQFDLVDISTEMLALARKQLSAYPNISFHETDFAKFNGSRPYELFFSSRALEYFPDKDAAIARIFSSLRPGGTGFIITKMPRYWAYRLMRRSIPAMHKGQIAPVKLKETLLAAGFENVRMYPVTMTFPFLKCSWTNKVLFLIFGRFPVNRLSALFSESYCVRFAKP